MLFVPRGAAAAKEARCLVGGYFASVGDRRGGETRSDGGRRMESNTVVPGLQAPHSHSFACHGVMSVCRSRCERDL